MDTERHTEAPGTEQAVPTAAGGTCARLRRLAERTERQRDALLENVTTRLRAGRRKGPELAGMRIGARSLARAGIDLLALRDAIAAVEAAEQAAEAAGSGDGEPPDGTTAAGPEDSGRTGETAAEAAGG